MADKRAHVGGFRLEEGGAELRLNGERVELPDEVLILLREGQSLRLPRIFLSVPVSMDSRRPHQLVNVPMPVYLTGRDVLTVYASGVFVGCFRSCGGIAVDPVEALLMEDSWRQRRSA